MHLALKASLRYRAGARQSFRSCIGPGLRVISAWCLFWLVSRMYSYGLRSSLGTLPTPLCPPVQYLLSALHERGVGPARAPAHLDPSSIFLVRADANEGERQQRVPFCAVRGRFRKRAPAGGATENLSGDF